MVHGLCLLRIFLIYMVVKPGIPWYFQPMKTAFGLFMPTYVSSGSAFELRRLTGGIRYDFEVAEAFRSRGFITNTLDLETLPAHVRSLRFPATAHLWKASQDKPFHTLVTDLGTSPLTLGLQERAGRAGILTVLICHHFRGHLEKPLLKRLLHRYCEKRIVAGADILVANSSHTRSVLVGMGRAPHDIILAPPGLNVPLASGPRRSENPATILAVGNIEERKGVIDAVRALGHAGLPSATLVLAGSDELEPSYAREVRALTERSGLSGRVRITGRLTDDELKGFFRSADVFMLLSRWEGYGMAIAEAMASGLPVLSTTAGAIPGIVANGVSGLLVEPGDWKAAGDYLRLLFTDAPLRRRLAEEALKSAAGFPTWKDTTDRIVQEVLSRLQSPSRK